MQFRALGEKGKTAFCVPAGAVDMHIKNASGSYFKVLLLLLRNEQDDLTSEDISGKTGIPSDEVDEAARYWIRCKILPKTVLAGASAEEKPKVEQTVTLSAKEISALVKSDSDIAFLFSNVESLLARPVTATEQKILVSMHEWLDLPVDVILMLYDYCLSIGKKSIRYIEKVAVSWADSGIVTHELAEEKIKSMKQNDELTSRVKSAFGIYGRNLTTNEKKYIKKWFESLLMPFEVVCEAYEIAVNNTGKISFAYINKILESWSQKGIKTVEQVKEETNRGKGGKKSRIVFENDSFDVDKFEEMGLYNIPDVK